MKKILILILALSACAPMPKEEITVEDCEAGNVKCKLCVDNLTGEGDWYVNIEKCPDGKYLVFLRK